MLVHSLNFYLLIQFSGEDFRKKFFNALIFLSSLFSVVVLIRFLLQKPEILFFPNANLLAGFLACGAVAAHGKIIFESPSADQPEKITSQKMILWPAVLLMIAAQLFIFSRGGLAALFTGFSVLFIVDWRKNLTPFLRIFIFCLFFFLIFSHQMRVQKIFQLADDYRIAVWKTAATALIQKPFLGWGTGNFQSAYEQNKIPIENEIGQFEKTTRFAHNEFLQIAVETGITGLFLFLWILYKIYQDGIRFLKKSNADWEIISAIASVTALLTQCFIDFNLHLPVFAFLLLFFCSVLVRKDNPETFLPKPAAQKFLKFILIAWIIIDALILSSYGLTVMARGKNSGDEKSAAIFYYKIAFRLNPFNIEAIKERALYSNDETSEKLLKWGIAFSRNDHALYVQLARFYFFRNRFDDSAFFYLKAIEKAPKNPFYYAELGDIYLRQNKLKPASDCYKKAIMTEPLYGFAHYRLGEIYLAMNNPSLAKTSFNAVIKIKESALKPKSEYSKRLLDFDAELAKKRLLNL